MKKKQDNPSFYMDGKKLDIHRKSELRAAKEWNKEGDKNDGPFTATATFEGEVSPEFREFMEEYDRLNDYTNKILQPILNNAKVDEVSVDPNLML